MKCCVGGEMADYREKWAILIGVNKYELEDRDNWLRYAVNDIKAIRNLLIESLDFKPANIEEFSDRMTDQFRKPSLGNILHQLERMKKSEIFHKEDLLVFYFSGHGLCNEKGRDILMPSDCSSYNWDRMGIAVEELITILSATGFGHIVLFLDACRQVPKDSKGSFTYKDRGLGDDTINATKRRRGEVTFLACDPEGFSYEVQKIKHGLFTKAVVEAIKEIKCETVSEVYEYIHGRVPKLAYKYQKPSQVPYMVASPNEMQNLILISGGKSVLPPKKEPSPKKEPPPAKESPPEIPLPWVPLPSEQVNFLVIDENIRKYKDIERALVSIAEEFDCQIKTYKQICNDPKITENEYLKQSIVIFMIEITFFGDIVRTAGKEIPFLILSEEKNIRINNGTTYKRIIDYLSLSAPEIFGIDMKDNYISVHNPKKFASTLRWILNYWDKFLALGKKYKGTTKDQRSELEDIQKRLGETLFKPSGKE